MTPRRPGTGSRRQSPRSAPTTPVARCGAVLLLAPGQQVRAPGFDLAWVAHTLQARLNAETCRLQGIGGQLRLVTTAVKVHGMAPALVQVPCLRPDVKTDEEKPA